MQSSGQNANHLFALSSAWCWRVLVLAVLDLAALDGDVVLHDGGHVPASPFATKWFRTGCLRRTRPAVHCQGLGRAVLQLFVPGLLAWSTRVQAGPALQLGAAGVEHVQGHIS